MSAAPEQFRELLSKRRYSPDTLLPPENKIFTIAGQTIGCTNSLVTFSGLPKSGKSTFLAGLVASRILHTDCLGMELASPKERSRIAYFDTESSPHDFYRQVERIRKFAFNDPIPEYIDMFCTREDSPGWQKALIEQYIKDTPEAAVVIVDGLLDLIIDYNDPTESRNLIQWIKTLTARHDILFITVLHTSKSGEQRLGHIGAGVDRYSQSVLEIVKENGNYILKPKYLRSSAGFEDIAISYDSDSGMYNIIGEMEPAPDISQEMLNLMEYNRRYTYRELIDIIKQAKNRGDNYAKSIIREMKDKKHIEKDNTGKYFRLVSF